MDEPLIGKKKSVFRIRNGSVFDDLVDWDPLFGINIRIQVRVSDLHILLCGSGSWSQLLSIWIRIRGWGGGGPRNTNTICKQIASYKIN